MGFSQVVAFILLFFGLIMVFATFGIFYTTSMDDLNNAAEQQRLETETIGSASIKINNTIYTLTDPRHTLEIEVINDGKVKLDPDHIDVFINETRIPRNDFNRTIAFYDDSRLINPLHFDPGERLKIEVYLNQSPSTNKLTVTTEYGANDMVAYSTP